MPSELPPGLGLNEALKKAKEKNPRRKAANAAGRSPATSSSQAFDNAEVTFLDSRAAASVDPLSGNSMEPGRIERLASSTQDVLRKLQSSSIAADPPSALQKQPDKGSEKMTTHAEDPGRGERLLGSLDAVHGSKKQRSRKKSRPGMHMGSASIPLSSPQPGTEAGTDANQGAEFAENGWPAGAINPTDAQAGRDIWEGFSSSVTPPANCSQGSSWDHLTPTISPQEPQESCIPYSNSSPGFATPQHHSAPAGRRLGANQKTGYTRHLAKTQLQEALKRGRFFRCHFRANASDRRQGFAVLEGLPADIQIQDLANQNRAITGDEVAVEILPQAQWMSQRVTILRALKAQKAKEGTADNPRMDVLEQIFRDYGHTPADYVVDEKLRNAGSAENAKRILIRKLEERPDLRATGRVVGILEPSFRRDRVIGALQAESWGGFTLLPVDSRMPKGRVAPEKVPEKVKKEVKEHEGDPETFVLVSAILVSWQEGSWNPEMLVRESIGQAGEIESETRAFLESEGVDLEDFDKEVLACLPELPWEISAKEVARRRDLRDLRLFTIDPATAKDLDDALSIEALGGGWWRVGVHIADVSHFIPPGSALDAKAALRATSVYLIQRVIPMLPPLLCEQLCSLNPGTDRLSFSVMWELDEQGEVLSQWVGRTIIRSCAKLAYNHAQDMIDGKITGHEGGDIPPVPLEAGHTWEQVVGDVLALNRIARKLHQRRFQNGALRLDNAKLSFRLNGDGNPASCQVYEPQEANELVAEFMLLANMSVAQLLGTAFPEKAMLRRHVRPEERKLGEVETSAQKLGFDIDCSTASSIHESLKRLRREGEDPVILDVLQLVVSKPMKQAQYFSTGKYPQLGDWRHFALAVPMYTHFTSPIRRYPDVVVHRLLAQLLEADSTASSRKFTPAPIGSLEHDALEASLRGRQDRGAAALREAALHGEALKDASADKSAAEAEQAQPANVLGSAVSDAGESPSEQALHAQNLADSRSRLADGDQSAPPAILQQVKNGSSNDEGSSSPIAAQQGASTAADPEMPMPTEQPAADQVRGEPPVAEGQKDLESRACEADLGVEEGAGAAQGGKPVPRLLAKTVKREERQASRKEKRQPQKGRIPISKELLESEDLDAVAQHCNMRKTSAKACSDASSRLFLCLLLRARPVVAEAVLTILNGPKFFDLYVPTLGVESRIHIADILPASAATWDAEQRVLGLYETEEHSEALESVPCLSKVRNADKLDNACGLAPLKLPLELKAFAKVPIVMSAKSPGIGKPLSTFAMLFLRTSCHQPPAPEAEALHSAHPSKAAGAE